jgi:hypothetical protein
MTYEELVESISSIVENPKIYKKGLIITYELNDNNYKQLSEHLFYKSNPSNSRFIPSDALEVELGGIVVNIIKEKKLDIEYNG